MPVHKYHFRTLQRCAAIAFSNERSMVHDVAKLNNYYSWTISFNVLFRSMCIHIDIACIYLLTYDLMLRKTQKRLRFDCLKSGQPCSFIPISPVGATSTHEYSERCKFVENIEEIWHVAIYARVLIIFFIQFYAIQVLLQFYSMIREMIFRYHASECHLKAVTWAMP